MIQNFKHNNIRVNKWLLTGELISYITGLVIIFRESEPFGWATLLLILGDNFKTRRMMNNKLDKENNS